jgi:hypothetical protein
MTELPQDQFESDKKLNLKMIMYMYHNVNNIFNNSYGNYSGINGHYSYGNKRKKFIFQLI